MLARSRAATGCAFLALAAGVAGCAGASGTTSATVTGKTLTIYASEPPGGVGGQQTQDVLAAERLALAQAGSQVGTYKIKLVTLSKGEISDHARTAIQDQSAIAYIGELQPGTSDQSLGPTNQADILQISPTDTALELTKPTTAVSSSPTRYYEAMTTTGRTFGRVVQTTAHEAKALAVWMAAHGVKKLYVADDGAPCTATVATGCYGKALAQAASSDAAAAGIVVVGGPAPTTAQKVKASGADAVFLGTASDSTAASLFDDVAVTSPRVMLFAPSAVDDDVFATALTPAAQKNTFISAPGFLRGDLTPAGLKFVNAFEAAYHHPPALGAIFGYEAMSLVLDVLRRAGTLANNRSDVVKSFQGTKDRVSALGTYSIDQDGDTTLAGPSFVLYRFVAGKLMAFKSLQVAQG